MFPPEQSPSMEVWMSPRPGSRRALIFATCLALALNSAPAFARQAPAQANAEYRIVVLEGEDAVNIIQQKTAVAPIVEIRDKNGLPVGGVAVTFAISSPNAVFAGGLQQLTVVTNAAGRAAISSLTPMSSGGYSINVAAAVQGQTVATTSIAQTNFMTLAEAAQAGAAGSTAGQGATQTTGSTSSTSSTGGSTGSSTTGQTAGTGATGGGGGGLSTLAIVGIAGAGVAATAGAVLVLKKEDCTYTVSPGTLNLGGAASSSTLTVSESKEGCEPVAWTASASGGFLTLSTSGGSGASSVTVSASANNSGGTRTGSITIAGNTVSVSQAAACSFTVTPGFGTLGSGAGNVVATITASPSGCTPNSWTASIGTATFVTSITPSSGSGSGVVTLAVTANTGAARSGTVTIAGQSLTISQGAGVITLACNSQAVAGSDLPVTRSVNVGRTSGRFTFTYDTYSQPDRMVVTYEGRTLFDTGCVGRYESRDISFSGGSSTVTVTVTPNCAGGTGTVWDFTVACARP
jgi:hypothetical protein